MLRNLKRNLIENYGKCYACEDLLHIHNNDAWKRGEREHWRKYAMVEK